MTREVERFNTLEKIKAEISTWVSRKGRSTGTLSAMAQVQEEKEDEEPETEVQCEDCDGNVFAAIVRKTGMKVKAAKGYKGGGK